MITLEFSNEDLSETIKKHHNSVKISFEGVPADLSELAKYFRTFCFAMSYSEDCINTMIVDPYGSSYIVEEEL